MGTLLGLLEEMLGVRDPCAALRQLLSCQAVLSSRIKGGLRSWVAPFEALGAVLGSAHSKTDLA